MVDFRALSNLVQAVADDAFGVGLTCFIDGKTDNACDTRARVHTTMVNPDIDEGTGNATVLQIAPRLVFLVPLDNPQAFVPNKLDVFIVNKHEGYIATLIEPRQGDSITAKCEQLSTEEMKEFLPFIGY